MTMVIIAKAGCVSPLDSGGKMPAPASCFLLPASPTSCRRGRWAGPRCPGGRGRGKKHLAQEIAAKVAMLPQPARAKMDFSVRLGTDTEAKASSFPGHALLSGAAPEAPGAQSQWEDQPA